MLPIALLFSALLLLTAVAAFEDLRSGEIPNRLIAVALLAAMPLHGFAQYSAMPGASLRDVLLSTLAYSGGGFLVCGLTPLLVFYFDAMGGGDVKLLATIGAFVGPTLGLEIQLYSLVLAALYAGARVAYAGQLLRLLASSAALLANPLLPRAKRRRVPAELLQSLRFAPAVFAASLVVTLVRFGLARWGLE